MSVESSFNQTATWTPKSSIDKFGDETFGSASTIHCRIQLKKMVMKTLDGNMIQADAVAYASYATNFRNRDRIDYTDSAGVSRRFEIIDVYEARSRATLNHKKLLLKFANV